MRTLCILAVLSMVVPGCGGGGGGGGGGGTSSAPPPGGGSTGGGPIAPLAPVDTSSPDHVINVNQSAGAIHAALQAAFNAGGIIVFNNASPVTIVLPAEVVLPDLGSAVLDGGGTVTLSGGSATRILRKNWLSTLTVQRLGFVDARTPDEGAAIHVTNWDGALTVIDCDFTNCKTTSTGPDIGGGAIRATGQTWLQVSGCTFTDCDGSNGGAICTIGCRITLVDCAFSGCNAFGSGGGADQGPAGQGGIGGAVYVDGVHQNNASNPRLDVSGCVFSGNAAGDHAGGLFVYAYAGTGSQILFDACTFNGNTVTGMAAGVYHQNGALTLRRSSFIGNTATESAGGIWSIAEGYATIENCTFQGNRAEGASPGFGGGLWLSGTFTVNACTIAGNHGAGWGGGLWTGTASSVTLRNTLLQNNTGTNIWNGWNVNATCVDGGNNMQWPTTRSNGSADVPATGGVAWANAQLQPIADNGGATWTMALPAGSPAINAGSAATAPLLDQRGMSRAGAPDIGAFEAP